MELNELAKELLNEPAAQEIVGKHTEQIHQALVATNLASLGKSKLQLHLANQHLVQLEEQARKEIAKAITT